MTLVTRDFYLLQEVKRDIAEKQGYESWFMFIIHLNKPDRAFYEQEVTFAYAERILALNF